MAHADQGDQQFGKMASEKQDEADAVAEKGEDPVEELPEGAGQDPSPRAGGKASEGAPSDADVDDAEEAAKESFPASDPPASY